MSSKPRLIVVTRSLPFHMAGGMEHVAWDLARAVATRGRPTTVLTTAIPDHPPGFSHDGVDVVALAGTPPGMYSSAWWRRSRTWAREAIADTDAVLSVSAGAYGLLAGRSRPPAARIVMQAHGTAAGDVRAKWSSGDLTRQLSAARNLRWLARDVRAYRRFDYIVAVGPRVETQLLEPPLSWFVPENRVTRIDNGVDDRCFRPDPDRGSRTRAELGWTADDLVVTTVCRLHPQKGVAEALRGVATFLREGRVPAKYLVVGDGPERHELETEAARMLPPGSFRFVGEVPREDIPGLLDASDVFLFTNLRIEVGMPLNVLEAAAAGLPLVLSHQVCSDLERPLAAECVEPGHVGEIAAALARIAAGGTRDRSARVSHLPPGRSLEAVAARYDTLLFPAGKT